MNLSFIKIDIQILNDTKVKMIRKMPEGDKLFMLWIGILCLAMRSSEPGELLIAPGLPFTDETLSLELDIPLNVVRIGLNTFDRLKMIEHLGGGIFYICNFEKYQTLEKIELGREKTRLRVQKHREKVKLLSESNCQDVTGYSVTGNAGDKIRIDKDEESEKFNQNSEEFRLSLLLFEKIKERDPKHKGPNLQKWSEHIEKLHRIEKRDYPEIEDVIIWSQQNDFWQNNILSTQKLREKFSNLYLQMKGELNKNGTDKTQTTINYNPPK